MSNQQLRQELKAKSIQIKALQKELLQPISALTNKQDTPSESVQDVKAQKLMEISKKARKLVIALEREKALNASLSAQVKVIL